MLAPFELDDVSVDESSHAALAAANYGLITRSQVLDAGGSRPGNRPPHRLGRAGPRSTPGVYRTEPGSTRLERSSPRSHAGRRASGVGIARSGGRPARPRRNQGGARSRSPFRTASDPSHPGVIVHRTRRHIDPIVVDAIPVAPPERTTLDIAWSHPSSTVELVYESALRKGMTTPSRVADLVALQGGWGVRGTGKVLRILDARRAGPAHRQPGRDDAPPPDACRGNRGAGMPARRPPLRRNRGGARLRLAETH